MNSKLDKIIPILFSWAKSKSFISRLWVYGSYVHGDPKPDSDIDIAIEVLDGPIDDFYTRFYHESQEWQNGYLLGGCEDNR